MSELHEVTTYIPAVKYCRESRTSYCLMVETEDYELSGCYVKFVDYEELRSKYLELQHMLNCLEKEKKDE